MAPCVVEAELYHCLCRVEATNAYSGCLDRLGDDGEVIEALLDEQADDAVRVEEKVASAGVLVAYDREQGLQLCSLRERVH